jgi:hypothetical protein
MQCYHFSLQNTFTPALNINVIAVFKELQRSNFKGMCKPNCGTPFLSCLIFYLSICYTSGIVGVLKVAFLPPSVTVSITIDL